MMKKGAWHRVWPLVMAVLCLSGKPFKPAVQLPKAFRDRFAWIPPSATVIEGRTVTTGTFAIARWEVSNAEYNAFLAHLKAAGDTALLRSCAVDTARWAIAAFLEPLAMYYHGHPAYKDYPVVNITHAAATEYCKWITAELNAAPGADHRWICRLPSRSEWMMAGQGGFDLEPYPWGNTLLNEKAEPRCNYFRIGDEHLQRIGADRSIWKSKGDTCRIMYADQLQGWDDLTPRTRQSLKRIVFRDPKHAAHVDPTYPVRSFEANGYGLFNMSGNVAELVDSANIAVGGSWINTGYDVRLWSTMPNDAPAPWIGFRPVIVLR